jgi:hypothetical protein
MGDEVEVEAEAETEEEHRHLRIRQASPPPSLRCAFKILSFSGRGRCETFAGGRHAHPSLSGDVLLVPVVLILTFLSRCPLEWWFCLPPGIRRRSSNTLAALS